MHACHAMRRGFLTFLFASLAAVSAMRAQDVKSYASYQNAGVKLELVTVLSDGGTVGGLLAMEGHGVEVTFAFNRKDWPALERLWRSAMSVTGSTYKAVGYVAETGTTEKCLITMAGGPAVRIMIVDPVAGALMFDIAGPRKAEFDARLREVAAATSSPG